VERAAQRKWARVLLSTAVRTSARTARVSASLPACRRPTTMAMAPRPRHNAALFAAAAAVRLLLFQAFPLLPDRLAGRVELSTPVSSFKRRT
jgi:hypothetical protein